MMQYPKLILNKFHQEIFTKLTDYKSEYKSAVAKLQNQYKDYSANANIAINKDKSNPVSSTIYSGCTTGAKKANTSLR